MIHQTKSLYKMFIINSILVFLFLTFIFGRSFMGLEILKYRIGEYLIAGAFFLFLFILFKKQFIEKAFGEEIYYSIILIFTTFSILLLLNGGSFFNEYTYKASLYIWALSFIFIGYFLFNNLKVKLTYFIFLNGALIFTYFSSTVYYPTFLIDFFVKYGDKFDFLKASHMLTLFVVTLYFNNRYLIKKYKYTYEYFLIISSIYMPLFIFKSRGAALGVSIFLISELFNIRKKLNFSKVKILIMVLISVFLFYFSTSLIIESDVSEEKGLALVGELIEVKNSAPKDIFSFYVNNGRLFSSDGNINWRLQIWQDVLIDSFEDFRFLKGVGFNDKIPVMNNPLYSGKDGTNEYVHNYLVNIYARGGILHLGLFIFLYFKLIKTNKKQTTQRDFLIFIIPFLIASLFDSSMSNPHFPLVFFFFIGSFFSNMDVDLTKQKIRQA